MKLHLAFKRWTQRHPFAFVAITAALFVALMACKAFADERTATDLAKDAAIDGLAAVTAIAGACEQAMCGNYWSSAALVGLGTLEAEKCYDEAREAWSKREND